MTSYEYESYRPGSGRSPVARRDSERSTEYPSDRSRDRRDTRERDWDSHIHYPATRNHNRERERDREREREREFFPSRRTQPEQMQPDEPTKMDPDKAAAELAKLHRQIYDVVVDKFKWSNKKEVELKGLKRRELDFKKAGGGSQFPAVDETFRKHQLAFKKQEEEFNKEIAKDDALLRQLTEDFGSLLVKHLPIGEIKVRQLTDAAKAEMAKYLRSTTPDGRFEKLEKQLASVQEAQESQANDLSKLRKENDELRTRNASYEAQATDLADLKAQHEELQRQFHARDSSDSEIYTLREEKKKLESQVSDPRTQIDRLRQDLTALENRFNEFDRQLSAFNAAEYNEAMDKLLGYPSWTELDTRIHKGHQLSEDEIKDLKSFAADAKGLQEVKKSLVGIQEDSAQKFMGFSTKIIDCVSKMVQDTQNKTAQVESRLNAFEDRAAATPRAASVAGTASPQSRNSTVVNGNNSAAESAGITNRVKAMEDAIMALRNELHVLQNGVKAIRNEVTQTLSAHETMIESLDDQFKNMTTPEMAQIILDHLKKLPPAIVSLDLQNLHERLANVEALQQEQTKRTINIQQWWKYMADHLNPTNKRRPADDMALGPQEKRQRVE